MDGCGGGWWSGSFGVSYLMKFYIGILELSLFDAMET